MFTIKQLLSEGILILQEKGIRSAALDARLILEHILVRPHEYIIANDQVVINSDIATKFNLLINRRINFEPIAYILGYKEFYGKKFLIDKNVLIPRPDTEILIDAVLDQVNDGDLEILELGAGSGCIIITLLLEFIRARGIAIEISELAIDLLQKNINQHGLENRLQVIKSNWFTELAVNNKFDLIVTNPPYIDESEMTLMNDETIKYEPSLALFAKEEGLFNYKIIAQNAKKYLFANGLIIVEIGYKQAMSVKDIFTNNGYTYIKTYQDLANRNRIMVFKSS